MPGTKEDWSGDVVYHWKYYVPPARASPSDLEFIKKKILEKGKDCKILIFGSTPEYRNMCGELGMSVTLIDFKKFNYEYLGKEVKNKPKEIFFEGNWLKTVLNEKFDIILADNVINVLMKEDIDTLLLNVSKMLKKDGLFMPRIYIRGKNERYTGEKAIKEYREERKGQGLYSGLGRNLYIAAYDFDKDRNVLKDTWEIVIDLHKKGLLTDEELKEYSKLSLKNREFYFFIPVKEDHEKVLSGFFEIKDIFNATEDYVRGKMPLYVLGMKSCD